ncbi:type II secretion system minor pseudopilin GspH [Oceanicoccus sp. KOV_DT_Chl]|uniref:type II secretion system minor pseudopilin GspH n=1 Tax=Oceanicoccus sp. KOV_DT_Chl TaxID=1904639 RepID=UPI000C7B6536|nr:type II secretion system minor pseudopilin GspH [Oceanicoccus sp. KOV_DT_Chl]
MRQQLRPTVSAVKASGFTLLEILLVLVVIAVMASLVAVSIGDNSAAQLDREADRLVAVLEMASEEALLQGIELSLASVNDGEFSGYQFLWLNLVDKTWQLLPDKAFGFYALPPTIYMSVELNDKMLEIDNQSVATRIKALQQLGGDFRPLIMFFSSGEITPFSITLRHPDVSDVITLRSDGVSGIERL